jgi:predicted AlkP superfamily phosphohydrolase/phosphomutase
MASVLPEHGRVVVIGLDMGDGALIRHWAHEGLLPNLQKLMNRGTWYDLVSPAQVLHTSTWPTFATGTLPGRHGVYYPFQPKPGYQQAQHVGAEQYGVPTFWKLADQAGKKCLVFDVPETFPEAGFDGRAIFEWGTWAWYGTRGAQPPKLIEDLRSRFGDYPLGMEAMRLGLGRPGTAMLQKKLPLSVAHKANSLQWLMQQGEWDLVVAAFCETHPAAHYLWPSGARDVASTESSRFRAMQSVYAAVDRAVGALDGVLPQDTTLLIVSGDGVRVNHAGWHLLPGVLEKLGYLNAGQGQDKKKSRSLMGMVKAMVPPRVRRLIADSLPWKLRNKLGAHLEAQVDWANTRAFTLPTDLEGCIRINLEGREPHGIVPPGAYKLTCEELRGHLEGLVNPATGRSAVRKVWICEEEFPGERRDQLPDVVVSWNDEAAIGALEIPGRGTVAGPNPDPRTGTHSTSGFLLAAGPVVAPGKREQAQLTQVAPTVLARLGLCNDFKLDGAPLAFATNQ